MGYHGLIQLVNLLFRVVLVTDVAGIDKIQPHLEPNTAPTLPRHHIRPLFMIILAAWYLAGMLKADLAFILLNPHLTIDEACSSLQRHQVC